MEEIISARKGLTSHTLKLIAIAAMLIDHIAWDYVPETTLLGILMHIIGRLTMPIMCYFVAEGFYHTRDKKKYALRLFIFALISLMPYEYLHSGHLLPQHFDISSLFGSFNVIFTLLLGLLALWACKSNLHIVAKVGISIGCCILACFADWILFGVLFILAFGLNHGNFKKQVIWFSAASALMLYDSLSMDIVYLFQLGVFLALPLLYLYKGERGGYAWSKWIFYVFYPLHLLILGLIKFGV